MPLVPPSDMPLVLHDSAGCLSLESLLAVRSRACSLDPSAMIVMLLVWLMRPEAFCEQHMIVAQSLHAAGGFYRAPAASAAFLTASIWH